MTVIGGDLCLPSPASFLLGKMVAKYALNHYPY